MPKSPEKVMSRMDAQNRNESEMRGQSNVQNFRGQQHADLSEFKQQPGEVNFGGSGGTSALDGHKGTSLGNTDSRSRSSAQTH